MAPAPTHTDLRFPASRRHSLLSPLNLAAYALWISTLMDALSRLPSDLNAWRGQQWFGLASVCAMLALFLAFRVQGNAGKSAMRALVLAEGIFILLAVHWLDTGMLPVLLVVVAVQLVMLESLPRAILFIFLLNVGLALIWHLDFANRGVLIGLLAYGSFQGFAGLTAWYARSAEHSRDELAAVNAHLLAARSLLEESARSEERLRLSRELHDVAGHKLTGLKLTLVALQRNPQFSKSEELHGIAALADELLQDIRAVVGELRKHDGIDLGRALQALARYLPAPRLHLNIGADARVDQVQTAEAILRCAQEALTNAIRHGKAGDVWITLERRDKQLHLQILDNGSGSDQLRWGNGLTGMRERLAELNGTLAIESSSGHGLRLTAALPVQV
jgi:signal transduction histidine kinase